ncbi:hypothetical protein ACQJBY_029785 [Aegilops geniculata]
MAEEAAAPLLEGLPEEIVIWEILVRLDPKSLLRSRAVRRAWRCATSTRPFLLAHHARQPTLPFVCGDKSNSILAFDHRAAADAQLHTVARLAEPFLLEASCDGLLVLSRCTRRFSVYNPVTREHASLRCPAWDFNIVGMYPHPPTGQYRLLLQCCDMDIPKDQFGCYVLPLGSDQPPRYIGCPEREVILALFNVPVWARHSLHWYPPPYLKYETESAQLEDQAEQELVIVFDTIAESFRQMRAPLASTYSSIFEVDGMLGIYSPNRAKEIVDIWVLQNYGSEIWDLKYRVELPLTQIRRKLEACDGDGNWYVIVASGDGDVLLLVRFRHWLFYVDTDGKLVTGFQDINFYKYGLKQTLVPHDFFTTREGFAADASPFI